MEAVMKSKRMKAELKPNSDWSKLPLFDRTGWKQVRFADVVHRADGRYDRTGANHDIQRWVAGEHIDEGDLHIRRESFTDDALFPPTFRFTFKAGHVLLHSRNPKKVAVPHFDGITGEKLFVLTPKDEHVLSKDFMPFMLLSEHFQKWAVDNSTGSVNKFLNWTALERYSFALPPLDQQRRIAELLWAVDEVRESYSATHASGMRMVDSALNELLYKASPWPMMRCEDILVDGPKNGYSPQAEAQGKGLPTLSISAIRDGKVICNGNLKYAAVSDEEVASYFLKPEDILVVRGNGNKQLCGRAGLVSETPDQCFYPDLLIRLRFDRDVLLPEFAVQLWNEPETFARLISRAKSSNGIWKINGKDVKAHELPVPSIQAQERFLKASGPRRAVVTAAQSAFDSTTHFRTALLNSFITS